MSWRMVVITGVAKLDLRLDFLVVRKAETTRIHISEIHTLLIESTTVSMTAALLIALTKRKVKIIFCDEKYNPACELISYYGSHDTSLKWKAQIAWGEDIKAHVWTEIVTEKIRKQRALLLRLHKKEEAHALGLYMQEMTIGDTTNREGHAAKVYFNALFGLSFTRSEDCALNAALNYGYSILLSAFNREIVALGYSTQLGVFHDNRFNPYNLSSDIMEPFRILVDEAVYQQMPQTFEREEKMQMVNILNQTVSIEGKNQRVHRAIAIYTRSVVDALSNRDGSTIKCYGVEL